MDNCPGCYKAACLQRVSTHCVDYEGEPLPGYGKGKQLSVVLGDIYARLADMDLREVEAECLPVPESQRGVRGYTVAILNEICGMKETVAALQARLAESDTQDNGDIERLTLEIDQIKDRLDVLEGQTSPDYGPAIAEAQARIAELQARPAFPKGIRMYTERIDAFDLSTGKGTGGYTGWKIIGGSDFEGRAIVNWSANSPASPANATTLDANYGKVGNTGGAENVTLSAAQMPAHGHAYTDEMRDDGNAGGSLGGRGGGRNTLNKTTSPAGGGQAHENRMPYVVQLYIEYTGIV